MVLKLILTKSKDDDGNDDEDKVDNTNDDETDNAGHNIDSICNDEMMKISA